MSFKWVGVVFHIDGHCTLSIPVAISQKYFIMLAIVLEEHSIHVQQHGLLKVTYSVEQAKSKIELQNEMSDFYIKASWMLNIISNAPWCSESRFPVKNLYMLLSSLRFGVVIVTNFPTLTWKGLFALYMSVGSKKTEKDVCQGFCSI